MSSGAAPPPGDARQAAETPRRAPRRAIVKLPPGALRGLKAGKADDMLAAFNVRCAKGGGAVAALLACHIQPDAPARGRRTSIRTIEDLGAWKHYQAARAIAVLAKTESPEGGRPDGAASNINGIVDKQYEAASLNELLVAPPSALQGLAPWTDNALAELKIKSVADLAKWKVGVRAGRRRARQPAQAVCHSEPDAPRSAAAADDARPPARPSAVPRMGAGAHDPGSVRARRRQLAVKLARATTDVTNE